MVIIGNNTAYFGVIWFKIDEKKLSDASFSGKTAAVTYLSNIFQKAANKFILEAHFCLSCYINYENIKYLQNQTTRFYVWNYVFPQEANTNKYISSGSVLSEALWIALF